MAGNSNQSRRFATIGLQVSLILGGLTLPGMRVHAGECDVVDSSHRPPEWNLTGTAIDTDRLPSVAIDPTAPADRPLPFHRLSANTYMLFGNIATLNKQNRGFNANAGFVVTEQGVIVIDALGTPSLGKRLISTIRCVTDRPVKYLIVTHNHPDHAYGATAFGQLDDITIIAHSGTVDYNHSATLESSVEYRRQLLPADMEGFEPLQADIYINEQPFHRKRIRLGEEVIDIYNSGEHHSYGDLVVHQVTQQILWISDLAFNQRTTYMGDGDSTQMLRAQEWLLRTFPDARLMVPGHGSAQTSPFAMVSKTRDYVTRMRNAMRQAVEEGVGMLDAVQSAEFDDWREVPLYEMNQKANANFVYREMEEAYFADF
jgi:glyoxylase-like metal-dependent hydrolase (beta-lactamase superfamily II)